MWELAPKFGARIVFVEHRYEGESLPPKNLSVDCLSYASTIQALADYARILEEELNPNNVASVIVFGGSYGGMLSAWMVSVKRQNYNLFFLPMVLHLTNDAHVLVSPFFFLLSV